MFNTYKISRPSASPEDGILNVYRMPARLEARLTAAILGFQEHDIPVLVSVGLLNPLGEPTQNATKYFAGCEIEALAQNPKWLCKATQVVYDHWRKKNKIKIQGNSRRQAESESRDTGAKSESSHVE
jgi:hypothetical protein